MPRWSLLLFVVVFAAVVALVLANREREDDRAPAAPPRAAPARGPDAHLRALQQIADEHGGTRSAGSPGDAATADYVERRLRAAGYRVSRQRFPVPVYRETSPPRLRVDGRAVRPIRTLQFSPGGTASGRVRAAGLGCADDDFDALQEGDIALIERGTCFFRDKAVNAERAGAAAALIVDQEREPVAASLQRPGLGIPVLALGAEAGEGLEGREATVIVDAVSGRRETASVIAESGPADAPRVVMAGGHLDSVPAGPGLNDNGSGVAALLSVAERLAAPRPPAAVRVLGRRGDRPRRLAPLRRRPRRRRAPPDRRLPQPRHGRDAGQRAAGLRRRPGRGRRSAATSRAGPTT